jgi:hypothetical protein
MTDDSLDRIQGDLATLRQAAGLELPFGKTDVRTNIWVAACGALIAVWSALAPWENRWLLAAPLVLAVAGAAWSARQAHRNRAAKPSPWREHRLGILAMLVVLPLVALYRYWETRVGVPRETAGAAAVFFVGVAALVISLTDRRRLSYLAAALPLIAFGMTIPLLPRDQVILAGGLCMMIACLSAAGIQAVQIKRAGDADGAH